MDVLGMATFNDATLQLPGKYRLSPQTFTTPAPLPNPNGSVAGPQLETGISGGSPGTKSPTLLTVPPVREVGVIFQTKLFI